ncbi:segregation/condensation protein A [Candidatus Woesearchaeota archaeon]|nr:segregation/condensation protein A [Candidatus Woesearchaeota archaeon]
MDVEMLSSLAGDVPKDHESRIFSILFQEDELTWQTIIHELVKTEQMDPWDVSIGTIADRFLIMLRKMKEMDFRVGGKMILAAALLLKMKSDKLMKEDIVALDNLINSPAEEEFDLLDDLQGLAGAVAPGEEQRPDLVPRTPQPRQRKVSVYDLVEALEEALDTETKKQVKGQSKAPEVKAPDKQPDMSMLIGKLYSTIRKKFSLNRVLTFDQLVPNDTKEDKVLTFIPLLHLDNQRKIDLWQKKHFDTITIKVNKQKLKEAEA